jgi:hypothetical protein
MTSTVEDRVLDVGLDELTTNTSHVYICDAASEPTTYARATGATPRSAISAYSIFRLKFH